MEDQATYDASSIKILRDEEVIEMFDFVKVGDLARRYPASSPDFIERMVEACSLANWPVTNAERRYLQGDKSVTPTPEFLACHRELADQRR
jgi:hypothetical protein